MKFKGISFLVGLLLTSIVWAEDPCDIRTYSSMECGLKDRYSTNSSRSSDDDSSRSQPSSALVIEQGRADVYLLNGDGSATKMITSPGRWRE